MTCKGYLVEKFGEEKANEIIGEYCPSAFGFKDDTVTCNIQGCCTKCWDSVQKKPKNFDKRCDEIFNEYVEKSDDETSEVEYELIKRPNGDNELKVTSRILDSGDRTQFETGAVRDMREGKGRCDLLPLDVVVDVLECDDHSMVLHYIRTFQDTGDYYHLTNIFDLGIPFNDIFTLCLEVAKHFEEGAKKYGDNNWRKGIPTHVYIDSAVRHYLKWLRGDKDEPHDRAFCWNILCCIWTCKHMPELNTYKKEEAK